MNISSYIKKHRLLLGITFFVLLVAGSFAVKIKTSQAGIGLPFGGRVLSTMICTCPATAYLAPMAVWISQVPQYTGIYMYSRVLSVTYSNYLVKPGSWVLGTYLPGVCMMYLYPASCYAYPGVKGYMFMVGTSL